MLGAGAQAAGSSPAGVGQPEEAPLPPTIGGGCRYINPATGDYQLDTKTRQYAQMPSTRQRVMIALLTIKGSSTVLPNLGRVNPQKMGDRFQAEMELSVRTALRQLAEIEQVIEIQNVTVRRGARGRSQTTVSYVDLETGEPDELPVP